MKWRKMISVNIVILGSPSGVPSYRGLAIVYQGTIYPVGCIAFRIKSAELHLYY